MRIDINDRETYPAVLVKGDLCGRLVTLLALSPVDAYALLQALDAQRDVLRDLATNYYDCPECGFSHRRGECASLAQEDEEQWDRTFASPEGRAVLAKLTAQAQDDEEGGFAPEEE
jgi:hypothetical protein